MGNVNISPNLIKRSTRLDSQGNVIYDSDNDKPQEPLKSKEQQIKDLEEELKRLKNQ